jgi:hypothetical protein
MLRPVIHAPTLNTSYYNLHGIGISVAGGAAPVHALDARLKAFVSPRQLPVDVSFEFERVHSAQAHVVQRPSRPSRAIYDPVDGEVLYDADREQLFIGYTDRIRAICDISRGHTRVSVIEPTIENEWLLSHPIVMLPLLEVLKRRGLFALHAAGLSREGRGILVAGTSGSGKTTLSIALARAGFDFLSDDMLFLAPKGGGLEVLAFPDEIDVTDCTATFFAELRPLLDQPVRPGWPKRSFRSEAMYGREPVRHCWPAIVVFPRIARVDTSVLEPMTPDEALLEMAPNILLTEPDACQNHLAALARLATSTPCYRLLTGRDFERLPDLLGALVA